jgi:hypothetical protein
MAPTLTAVREQTYNDTLDDEIEMLEVAHTLKGRLTDMNNPDMWMSTEEHLKHVAEIIAAHDKGERWNGI